MEFLVTSQERTAYIDSNLEKATNEIYKLGDSIKRNWFAIAHYVALVDVNNYYAIDGFENVHQWTENAFGLKKSASYNLLNIGRQYIREITNKSGKVTGYGSNLVQSGDDFSKTQVEEMLPLGHDTALALVEDGTITPQMTVKEIKKVVKDYRNPETAEEPETEEEPETVEEPENVKELSDSQKLALAVIIRTMIENDLTVDDINSYYMVHGAEMEK